MGHRPLLEYGAKETEEERVARLNKEWGLKMASRRYADYLCSMNEEEPELDGERLQYVYSTCMGINKAIAQVTNEAAERYYMGF